MKKFGFTLAEILVALAIVGMVAAVSIPTMVTENKKKVWANSLSVAVSDFENAMTTYLVKEGESNLQDTKAWSDDYFNKDISVEKALGKSFKIKKVANKADDFYGSNIDVKHLNTKINTSAESYIVGQAYQSKSGIVYFINQLKGQPLIDSFEDGGKLEQLVAKIGIDINGKKGPNRMGRDVFVFFLGADGYLFPYGSKDVNLYDSNYTLLDETNCSGSVTGNAGQHCAARLAGNGYKMDY